MKGETEMKKDFGKKNWMVPMPVLMVGSYDAEGRADFMPAAWGGVTLEDEITICIDTEHKTWGNLAAKGAFTVAFATARTVEACDYLGLVSGKDVPDKAARSGLTVARAAHVDAPVAEEWPLVLECEVAAMEEESCRVVGKIVNCAVEESALTGGKPDATKMGAVCYDPCGHVYRAVGEVVAKAFSCGKERATAARGAGAE